MTTTNQPQTPVVTKMADIDQLIATGNTSAPPAGDATEPVVSTVQTVADYTDALESRAKALCEKYITYRISGGKRKAFLAALSKKDLHFFEAMDLEAMSRLAIKEHLDGDPKDLEAKTIYDAMVAQEAKRLSVIEDVTGANLPGNPKFGKGDKEGKSGTTGKLKKDKKFGGWGALITDGYSDKKSKKTLNSRY